MSDHRNPFLEAALSLTPEGRRALPRSQLASRYFLNPMVPRALRDDPDGSFHYALQVTDAEGRPLRGLRKGDPIPLTLRWYQREVIDSGHRRRVLRFGRRVGKTFTIAVDVCLEAVLNPNARILILAPYESQVKLIFDDGIRPLLRAYRHQRSRRVGLERRPDGTVPPGHDLAIRTDTKKPQEIVLTNGSTIRGMVITHGARGQSATFVVVDEADYADDDALEAIVAPILMTSPETRVIMASTPSGRANSFYWRACHSPDWQEFHRSFEVLPHYTPELRREMADLAGGEHTNTFKQEYLAEWGTDSEGVFNTQKLELSFIVAPYIRVLEEVDFTSRHRRPLLAWDGESRLRDREGRPLFMDYRDGARPMNWDLGDEPGSVSVWRSPAETPGVITLGTDWNEHAGMQTVAIWWPDPEWLRQGHLKVARFDYRGGRALTSDRARDSATGQVRLFTVGSDNGDPGGPHDLSQVEGIVIWHGRLESGYFNWQMAANRVISIMSIPGFVWAWYVDYGYGSQVLKLIEGIMASGQYIPDGGGERGFLPKAVDIPEALMRNILRFHPDRDTGFIFKAVNFSAPYEYLDFGYVPRGEMTKDVMVALARRKIEQRRILIPYGELYRLASDDEVGSYVLQDFDGSGFGEEHRVPVRSRDIIEETGAEPPRGDGFGGLIHQMRNWRIVGRTSTGRPRYEGVDHAIDAFMLAVLAYEECFAPLGPNHPLRSDPNLYGVAAETELLKSVVDRPIQRPRPVRGRSHQEGDFRTKRYTSERAPLDAILRGELRPEEAGSSMGEMLRAAMRHLKRRA
mgnify:CR=1 FL=1